MKAGMRERERKGRETGQRKEMMEGFREDGRGLMRDRNSAER